MRILLTNDDGIDAEGLQAFATALSPFAEILVVAPMVGCSCCGHSVTTHRPIAIQKRANDWYAIDGFPADCVRVALRHFQFKPDWVLSGINHGGNLGADIAMSGTVAAAREAKRMGVSSIAFSQYRRPDVSLPWNVSASRASDLFRWICDLPLLEKSFWNANLPAIGAERSMPSPQLCEVDSNPFEFQMEEIADTVHYRGDYHNRPRSFGTDVAVCFSGVPSVSELPFK